MPAHVANDQRYKLAKNARSQVAQGCKQFIPWGCSKEPLIENLCLLCLLFIRHCSSKDFNLFTLRCLLDLRHTMVSPMYVTILVDFITWFAVMGCVAISFFSFYVYHIKKIYCSILLSLICHIHNIWCIQIDFAGKLEREGCSKPKNSDSSFVTFQSMFCLYCLAFFYLKKNTLIKQPGP